MYTFFYKQGFHKQRPEAEFLRFENYSHFLSMLSKEQEQVCLRLIIMQIKTKMENKSHRYDINRLKSRHKQEYSKYKKCLPRRHRT